MPNRTSLPNNTILQFGERRFRIQYEIGRGGNSVVYLAASGSSSETYIVKEYYPHNISGLYRENGTLKIDRLSKEEKTAFDNGLERFRQCAEQKAKLSLYSSNIKNLLPEYCECFPNGDTAYILTSDTIGSCYSEYRESNMTELLRCFLKLCRAINEFHKHNLLFLDIKPENVLLINDVTSEDGHSIKLFDFESVCSPDTLRKAPVPYDEKYSSPEQKELACGANCPVDRRSDIYSLGAVLYNRITGSFPGGSAKRGCFSISLRDIQSGLFIDLSVCKKLENVFCKTLNPSPIARYDNVESLIGDLTDILRSLDKQGMVHSSGLTSCGTHFIAQARQSDNIALLNLIKNNGVVLVYGMAGLGKTEFIRSFISSKNSEIDFGTKIYIASTGTSILNAVINDSNVVIEGFDRNLLQKSTDSVALSDEDYFKIKLSYIQRECDTLCKQGKRMIIVFDNAELFSSSKTGNENLHCLEMLRKAGCWCIIVSDSTDVAVNHIVSYRIAELEIEYLREIFTLYCEVPDDEYYLLDELIRRYKSHTLAVELLARGITNSYLTLPNVMDSIADKDSGIAVIGPFSSVEVGGRFEMGSISEILSKVFISAFSDSDNIFLLQLLSLSSDNGFSFKDFRTLADDRFSKMKELEKCGCITVKAGRFYLHPLIRETISDLYTPGEECIQTLYNFILNQKKNISKLSTAEVRDCLETGCMLLKSDYPTVLCSAFFDAMGKIYSRLGMNNKSVQMYEKAISCFANEPSYPGSKSNLAVLYMRLARTYMSGRDIEKSRENLKMSYETFAEIRCVYNDPQIELDYVKTLNQMAIFCCYTGDIINALSYCTEAFDIAEKIQNCSSLREFHDRALKKLYYVYDTYGRILLFLGEYEQAEKYYQKSLNIKKQYCSNEDLSLTYSYRGLAESCYKLDRLIEAKDYIDLGIRLSEKKRGKHGETSELCILCAGIYEANGLPNEALDFYLQGVNIYRDDLGDNHIFTICAEIEYELAIIRLGITHDSALPQLYEKARRSVEELTRIDTFRAVSLADKLITLGEKYGDDVSKLRSFREQFTLLNAEIRRI